MTDLITDYEWKSIEVWWNPWSWSKGRFIAQPPRPITDIDYILFGIRKPPEAVIVHDPWNCSSQESGNLRHLVHDTDVRDSS